MKKYKKILLISLFFFFSTSIGYSQFLHIGARAFFTPVILMDYYEYQPTDYVFYFSNDKNETVRFDGFEFSAIKNFVPAPDIYIRYDLGNHVFFQADVFTLRFNNQAKFKNSVNYSEFVQNYNPVAQYDNLEYNSIDLRWKFTGNSLSVGYKFLKAKRLRPFVFTGITALYLRKFEHRSIEDQVRIETDPTYARTVRDLNDILFKNLDTFSLTTLHSHFGFGFKFHGITFDFYATNSLKNRPIDIYADKYSSDKNAFNEDISLSERANYKSMYTFNSSLSVNLLSFNLTKKQLKY